MATASILNLAAMHGSEKDEAYFVFAVKVQSLLRLTIRTKNINRPEKEVSKTKKPAKTKSSRAFLLLKTRIPANYKNTAPLNTAE